jgi:hypothetical protein
MKKIMILVSVSFLALFHTSNALAKDVPASAEELRSRLEAALRAKDTNAITALVNWEGVGTTMQKMVGTSLGYMTKQDVAQVTLKPLPPGFIATNDVRGTRYRPNIAVAGMLYVQFAKSGSASLPYGQKGGGFYLPGTLEEKLATGANEKSLAVLVMGSGSTDVETFTGSYVYLKGGKEVTEKIVGRGNYNLAFWADGIKSFSLKKTAGKSIHVLINEDGKSLFDSGDVTDGRLVVYNGK